MFLDPETLCWGGGGGGPEMEARKENGKTHASENAWQVLPWPLRFRGSLGAGLVFGSLRSKKSCALRLRC